MNAFNTPWECPDLLCCMIFSFVSFGLSIFVSVSQLYQIIKTKNTSGIAISTYTILFFAGIMCLLWALSYYYKTLMTNMSVDGPGSVPIISWITNRRIEPYGPYWLWQWGIIPIIGYYSLDIIVSVALIINKAYHLRLAKKLKMNEIQLSEYLKNKQWKTYLRTLKPYHKKYFWFIVFLIVLFTFIAVEMWAINTYARPDFDRELSPDGWIHVIVLNFLSAAIWEAMAWPQFIKCLRHKDTSGISMVWAIVIPTSMTVSFGYALTLALATSSRSIPVLDTLGALIFNGLIVNYGVLIIKLINRHKAKKHKMNELLYTKKYIIPKIEKQNKHKVKLGK